MAKHKSAFKDNQREIAKQLGIPRSTLQHWMDRKDSIDAEPEVKAFFESPTGTAFLHRLVVAAQFVITLLGPGSVRLVCEFLELSGLSKFIAASYGSQQKVSVAIEQAIVDFGNKETNRMAKDMEPKDITACLDETFHPETCLVSIEPESNYILLETYADGRKGSDWMKAMEDALKAVVHNYFIKRRDETTPAERFFGAKPNDLFSFLLDKVDIPRRPAKKRFKPEVKKPLIAVG
ncbi:hypothetical protein DSCO28_39440 [Desulfosarcina ovata subsp. sediminis]|uniref:Uncharacterized protein n=1 Tax=Desulfosarcina ovata subsp. sediminis TaxID=885957 RepID=A0A5K7ZT47_9BACT|nr:DUF6399 domain-containing protein [Desulfosarcina ovata]BBO83378.1 hypothetical protein DSCO28_39440 [Desulfosarcina ovata subsp. sediminis]